MQKFSLAHLSDACLTRELGTKATGEHDATALVLAHLAEFNDRKLYLPAGHPSMLSYCVHVLDYSDAAARRRIHAARTAREYPAIFERVADGRLHLTAVNTLAAYLTPANADDLIESATRRSKVEIEELLAERFAHQPVFPPVSQQVCGADGVTECPESNTDERALARVQNETPGAAAPTVAAQPPNRAPWPITVDPSDHEKLREAQALLSHQIPSRDVNKVLSRLIDLGLAQLRKQKRGIGRKPGTSARRPSSNARYIPNEVKQAVWERDGGQCTFTSESGHRCPAREFIEYDRVVPVARGGMATVENLRLRCRAHNQYEAERTFGSQFMKRKRENARPKGAAKPTKAPEPQLSAAAAEVVPWLRGLGFKIAEANAAAALCESMECEPLEKRVRVALSYFRKSKAIRVGVPEMAISGAAAS